MVAPITGPFITERFSAGYASYDRRESYKQSRPITSSIILPYIRKVGQARGSGGLDNDCRQIAAYNWYDESSGDLNWNPLIDKAYDRLKNKLLGDSALWAVNLIEANQSLTSLTNRANQLRLAWRALARWDLPTVAKILKHPVPKKVSKRKSVADNWLEYHFGWSPLAADIGNSIDILQRPFKPVKARASASDSHIVELQVPSSGSNPGAIYPALLPWNSYDRMHIRRTFAMGARVEITNPNLFLAERLGFINPAVIAWEAIPFSFVADWFTNIGSFLSNGSDFLGCSLSESWNTRFVRMSKDQLSQSSYRWVENGSYVYGGTYQTKTGYAAQTCRRTGLVKPDLYVRPLKLWGWERAATAVSLLIQQFAGAKR